jgi:hypothetical protein
MAPRDTVTPIIETGTPAGGTPFIDAGVPIIGTPFIETGVLQTQELIVSRKQKLIPARTVQIGHTHGEQLVYETLWRLGKPSEQGNRKVIIGIATLAPKVPISYNNCQANLRSLITKLVIDDFGLQPFNTGRLYTVYSYTEILERRRKAGMLYVLRLGRSLLFNVPP